MKLLPLPPSSLRVLLSKLKVLWSQWNVQTMVLTSFVIQLILIFLAPFRKQTSSWIVVASIWVAYLLADWVAIQALGLIAKPCGRTTTSNVDQLATDELYAFWAQFLLLHLGGPDTITALALEDSELWLRTGLHLSVQVYGGLGVLVKSVGQSSLWVPTLLIFVAGIIKYLERVSSLFHGRLLKFCEQDHYSSSKRARLQPDGFSYSGAHAHFDPSISTSSVEGNKKDLTHVEMVRCACFFFDYYKGLFAGREPNRSLQTRITPYISKRNREEVLGVVEIQLNLAYEVFYTKTVIIRSPFWKALRLVVTLLQLGCLVIWVFFTDKQGFGPDYNIRITYTLLVGAVAVDVLSFLRIQFWSDWTIAQVTKDSRIRNWFYNRVILSARKRTWGRYWRKEDAPMWACFRRAFFRRWSESIPQMSLIDLCAELQLPDMMRTVVVKLGVKEALERRNHVTRKWFSDHLRDFIFRDLKQSIQTRGGVENICKVKGGWACISLYQAHMISLPHVGLILGVHEDYDVVVMRWHIITELCYYDETGSKNSEEEQNYREVCKTLSDYLIYLLCHQQDMMPLIPYASEERLEEAERTLKVLAREEIEKGSDKRKNARRQMACRIIRAECTRKDARSYEVYLFPIEPIMRELRGLEEKRIGKWEFMAKVWAELLYYAAFHCKPNLHATMLKQGGELVSFVWLLLRQLGFGINERVSSRSELHNGEGVNEPTRALLYAYNQDGWKTP